MGFFNPITYFIKNFIRLFTKKFFWLILVVLFVFCSLFIENISLGASNPLNDDLFYYPDGVNPFTVTSDNGVLQHQVLYKKNDTYYMFVWYIRTGQTASNLKLYMRSGLPYTNANYHTDNHCCIYQYNGIGWSNKCWWYMSNGNFPSGNSSGNPYNYVNGATLISSSHDIYTNSSCDTIYVSRQDLQPIFEPYIATTTNSIENWSFNNFNITSNISLQGMDKIELEFNYTDFFYQDVTSYLSYDNYNTDYWTISIPRNEFFNNVSFNSLYTNSYPISFTLKIYGIGDYSLGGYSLTLSPDEVVAINSQNQSNQQQNIINNLENSNISNEKTNEFSRFSNNMNINDTTSINSIFEMIYDAYTTKYGWHGTPDVPYEIEITIPFVNKTFKLSPYTIYGKNWWTDEDNVNIRPIKSFISTAVWGVVCLWVLKDIRSTINKVAEGKIEDCGSDVKKEVL